jgi:hypothetical protein
MHASQVRAPVTCEKDAYANQASERMQSCRAEGGVVHCMQSCRALVALQLGARPRSHRCMLSPPQKSKGPREAINFSKSTWAHLSQPWPASHQLNPRSSWRRLPAEHPYVHAMHIVSSLNTPARHGFPSRSRTEFDSIAEFVSHGKVAFHGTPGDGGMAAAGGRRVGGDRCRRMAGACGVEAWHDRSREL